MLINGAPGIGKSSLGHRYVADRPRALLFDIDAIRAALGHWRDVAESKAVARRLAVALAEAHLRHGYDIVVPQYVGSLELIEVLDDVARRCRARFIVVVLDAPIPVAVERFRSRRRELVDGQEHPQAEVSDEDVDSAVEEATSKLVNVAARREGTVRLGADQEISETSAELIAAIRGTGR